ncbi:MAG: DegT/DnrJ/EryC1/StrS family aminotransferase [Candidatus Woesearchaeota archaeon]
MNYKIQISKPNLGLKELKAIREVFKSGILVQGPKVEQFEKEFSDYVGTKYGIATSSGTTALHLAALSAGIKEGDEVIVSSFTFVATANCVLYCKAKPVFADINEDDYNINIDDVQKKITSKTRAIIPVHLYGQSADMKAIMDIAEDKNLIVIEDACQAHGAEFNKKKVGSFGIGVFSFYATKNITTGEGGMITTDDERINELLRMLRSHGSKQRYYHEILGFNYRMTDIQAAIGLVQLKNLEKNNKKRIKNARILTKGLKNVPGIITPRIMPNRKHVFHQYTIRITPEFGISREELMKKLEERGIQTMIYYPLAIHKQKLYLDLGYKVSLPVTEKIQSEILSLPVHPLLKREDLNYIIQSIGEISKR